MEELKKCGPMSKQILNYSYPPLLYQRGEDDSEEDDDEGEGDDDADIMELINGEGGGEHEELLKQL